MPTIIMTVVIPDNDQEPHWIDPPENLRGEYTDLASARSKLIELGAPDVEYVIIALKERIRLRHETRTVVV